VTHEFEAWIIKQRKNVFATTGEKVIEADHIVTFTEQSFTQMRTNKPGTAGD